LFILVFLFADSTPEHCSVTGDCEGCANPLVQIMPLQIGGDISESDEYGGWDDIKEGARNFSDDWVRGFEYATNFIKKIRAPSYSTRWTT
jgi:hypothetical protein